MALLRRFANRLLPLNHQHLKSRGCRFRVTHLKAVPTTCARHSQGQRAAPPSRAGKVVCRRPVAMNTDLDAEKQSRATLIKARAGADSFPKNSK
ncbi:hypothetical protein EVAR_24699_1 [Eumeta japonica]|uniref:Uncharacterized protein n=1 Tax=Eumeta variegata TaxID=151549 RepID=A0A4C1WGX2_EUMVA|nr:hypothetical protein EVAR_24699_1 [Eumeta japonica]